MKKNTFNKIVAWGEKLDLNISYLLKNSFWVSVENIVSLVSGLLVVYAMGNFIDANTAGQYKYLISLAAIISSFTIAGVTFAVTRETAMGHDSFFHFATIKSLKWSILPMLIAFVIAIYYFVMGNKMYAISFFLATFFTIMISNFSLYRSYLSGKENFKQITKYGNFVLIVGSFFSIITFYFTDNLSLLVLGTLGSNFLLLLYIYIEVRGGIEKKDLDKGLIKNFNQYVYSQSFVNIIAIGATHMDKVILFQFLGPVELAIYTFVTVLPEKIRGLLKSFSSIIFTKFVKRDIDTIKEKMFKESVFFFTFLFVCFIGTLAITPLVFSLFLPRYVEYTYLSLIYSISIFSVISLVPYSAIQAKNYKKDLYFYEIFNSFMQISFVAFGAINFGLTGAVVGKVSANTFGIVTLYLILFKDLFFRRN